jgi:activator of HSP90 ATPase
MPPAIIQSVVLKASPEELFDAFLDSKQHSEFTGAPAKTSPAPGAAFQAWGGQLSGRNLHVVPGKMIVQAWRANHWPAADPDSILILQFSKAPGGGRIDLTHVNVPPHDHRGVAQGWTTYYWKPWKAHLAKKKKK